MSAATLSGFVALADTASDRVEVRTRGGGTLGGTAGAAGVLHRAVTRQQIAALLPWVNLTEGPDGPEALVLSDTGRLLFIAVRSDEPAPDSQPPDAILRLDVDTGDLRVFARLDLGSPLLPDPRPALAHFRGRLHVGTPTGTRVLNAQANTLAASQVAISNVPTSALAVDRDSGTLFGLLDVGGGGEGIVRAPLGGSSLNFTPVAITPPPAPGTLLDIAWSDHFGGPSGGGGGGGVSGSGLWMMVGPAGPHGPTTALQFLPANVARGQQVGGAATYIGATETALGEGGAARRVAALADGGLMLARDASATVVREASETRLSFDAWSRDEFVQVVNFAKGLVSPDGEPPGWVIDADVQQGWTRFHPASADAAGWTVLLCLISDRVGADGANAGNGDPEAREIVRTILRRYAGRSPDGVRPLRSADGIYWHWLDPVTGGAKAGWGDSYATLSTMKIVLAAARAARQYPTDAEIRASARAIICGVRNWDSYFASTTARPIYFLGNANGGPQVSSASNPYNEGVLLAAQAGFYGGSGGQAAYARWVDRTALPFALWLTGRPITGGSLGQFQAAFVSLYAMLTDPLIRASPTWREHYTNLRSAHAAWTDDNGPRFSTVFSAGTTKPEWGGYSADSLSGHPGDVTTFTALLALTGGVGDAQPRGPEAVAAYQAYRRGARQTFLGGASILYRRSAIDPAYQPNSAGLPDVALGALGLADLLAPSSVDEVLAAPFPTCAALSCAADINLDGALDPDDLADYIACYFAVGGCRSADVNGDGASDPDDLADYIAAYFGGCE